MLGDVTERTPAVPADPLDRLAIHRHCVRLVATERLVLPRPRLPNMLRGSFEMSFRRLVCHDTTLDCRECPLRATCPYPPIFRPSPPASTERLSKQQDLPRPFLFEPPAQGHDVLEPGAPLQIGLTAFGSAQVALPYLVVALRALGDRGLGPTRGRLRLERVSAETPAGAVEVFDGAKTTVRTRTPALRLAHLHRPGDDSATRLRVRFLTPTTLKRDGRLIERPTLGDLAVRIRDRLSSLASFFGDGPLDIDFKGLARAADAVRTVECRTSWQHRTRRSSRTGETHETSGFTGEATYEGDLGPLMPLVRMGERLHVGKYAVWGNGWLAAEVLG
jgi:hypothetical protein